MKWFFALLLGCCLNCAAGQKKVETPPAADTCDRFEPQVQKLVDNKDYLNALNVLADYEQALQKLSPPPVFTHGVYQNTAHHLSIRSGFDGWHEQPEENIRVPAWLRITGFETLLALEGAGDDQKFVTSSIDTGRIERRFGQRPRRPDAITDDELIQNLRTISANLGTVQTQQFKIFSGRRMLVSELRGRGGIPVAVAITGANGQVYRFVMITSEAKQAQDNKKFLKTLDNVRFDFKPANTEKIESIRSRAKTNTINESLMRTRALVSIGEYGAALDELANVRMLVGHQMPGPVIEGDTARQPLYGISLRNPDAQKWRLTATNQAGVTMLILEDRFSVTPTGVMAMVVNPMLMFGPQFVEAVIDSNNELLKKELLAGAGRGALGKISTRLESESYLMFRGMMAYQGIGIGKSPNAKLRQILTANRDYLLTVLEMAGDRDFDAKCKEFDDILEKNLELKVK